MAMNPTDSTAPSRPLLEAQTHRAWMRVAASVREAEAPRLADVARELGWVVTRSDFDDATCDIELSASGAFEANDAHAKLEAMARAVDAASVAGGVLELTLAGLDEHGMPESHVRFTGPDAESLEFAQLRYGLMQAQQHLQSVLGAAGATHVLAQATRIATDLHTARLSVMPSQTPKGQQVKRSRA